jgi:threonine dehydrogenase-like Zn-dependent dehydrogenase
MSVRSNATAAAHGANGVVDATREPAAEAVLAATGGAGVAAAEFVGEADSIAQAVASLAIGGRAVIAGLGAEPIAVQPPTFFVRRELQILSPARTALSFKPIDRECRSLELGASGSRGTRVGSRGRRVGAR